MTLLLHGTWYKLLIVTLKRILPSGTYWEGWIDILPSVSALPTKCPGHEGHTVKTEWLPRLYGLLWHCMTLFFLK